MACRIQTRDPDGFSPEHPFWWALSLYKWRCPQADWKANHISNMFRMRLLDKKMSPFKKFSVDAKLMPLQFYSVTFIFSVHAGLSFTLITCEVLLSSIAQTATLCKIYFEVQTKYLSPLVCATVWMCFYGSVSPWFPPSKQEYTMCFCFTVSLGCWYSLLQYDYSGIAN